MDGRIEFEGDDCADCPACRTRALIYRELVELRCPMILPIAQTVVSELTPEVVEEFGGAEAALNSILLTAAEEFGRTSRAGCSKEGLTYIVNSAERLKFDDFEVNTLLGAVHALAESSGRLEHR